MHFDQANGNTRVLQTTTGVFSRSPSCFSLEVCIINDGLDPSNLREQSYFSETAGRV